jgi:hypothetical protein
MVGAICGHIWNDWAGGELLVDNVDSPAGGWLRGSCPGTLVPAESDALNVCVATTAFTGHRQIADKAGFYAYEEIQEIEWGWTYQERSINTLGKANAVKIRPERLGNHTDLQHPFGLSGGRLAGRGL